MQKQYPSKLMLFGEYAVIAGGEGLAIPYDKCAAKWINNNTSPSIFKPYILEFLGWLKENNFAEILNLFAFESDLNEGLDIDSNVPIGYGLGSSGVVVAAVFDKYAIQIPDSLEALKKILGSMENYFHATSSGLDPLVCYTNKAIHVMPNQIERLGNLATPSGIQMQLLDCGNARSTQQLVAQFNEKLLNEAYKFAIGTYIKLSNTCIKLWIAGETELLFEQLHLLSAFQFQHFQFAIPNHMQEKWLNGLNSGNKIIKLCGAGGGGYLIEFSKH